MQTESASRYLRNDDMNNEGSLMTHLYAVDNTVAVKFCAFDYFGTALVLFGSQARGVHQCNRDDVVGME